MIVDIKVDLEDFEMDENENFTDALRQYILDEVKREIWSKTRGKITEEMGEKISAEIKNLVDVKIKDSLITFIKNTLEDQTVKGYGKDKSLKDYVHEKIVAEVNHNYGHRFGEIIKKLATEHLNEIKKKYDLLYAVDLLKKVKDAGLLDENLGKLLTGESTTQKENKE